MSKKKNKIRVLALCVFHHDDIIFVAEGYDPHKQQRFYRPIGGGIDFGERAADALRREVREELDADITGLRYLGTLENIFTYAGEPGHEIALIFDGIFVDTTHNQLNFVGHGSDDNQALYTARYMALDIFRRGEAILYPDGLLALLDNIP
jgi:ADP-ribose pyrophosphatase YjhB (NUDIX family)